MITQLHSVWKKSYDRDFYSYHCSIFNVVSEAIILRNVAEQLEENVGAVIRAITSAI